MERGPVTRGIAVGLALTGAAAILAIASVVRARGVQPEARVATPDATPGDTTRVRVEVLNATTTRGLARRATRLLRDRGLDVVDMGTASERLDSTLVLDRSGHPGHAHRVAEALGGARVEARPDSSRYLDVTVLLGRSWRPPPQPFNP